MPEDNIYQDYENNLLADNSRPGEDDKDLQLARWQLDLTEMLNEMAHHMRGDEYDAEKNIWVNHPEYKLMNEKGIREITYQLKMANRNIFLSNLNEDEIRSMMKFFMISFTVFLSLKWSEFEINKKNLTIIKENVLWVLYPGLKRSQMAGERKSLYQTQRVIETTVTHPGGQNSEKKGGILGALFRRK